MNASWNGNHFASDVAPWCIARCRAAVPIARFAIWNASKICGSRSASIPVAIRILLRPAAVELEQSVGPANVPLTDTGVDKFSAIVTRMFPARLSDAGRKIPLVIRTPGVIVADDVRVVVHLYARRCIRFRGRRMWQRHSERRSG